MRAAHPQPSSPSSSIAVEDPVPPDVRAVIDLFASQLAKVAFPDVDAAVLRHHADELRGEAATVAKARAALDDALASYATRIAAVSELAARAVAYARIYSAAHPDRGELADALAAFAPPNEVANSAPVAPAKRRGRPPRRTGELFDAAPLSSDASSADELDA